MKDVTARPNGLHEEKDARLVRSFELFGLNGLAAVWRAQSFQYSLIDILAKEPDGCIGKDKIRTLPQVPRSAKTIRRFIDSQSRIARIRGVTPGLEVAGRLARQESIGQAVGYIRFLPGNVASQNSHISRVVTECESVLALSVANPWVEVDFDLFAKNCTVFRIVPRDLQIDSFVNPIFLDVRKQLGQPTVKHVTVLVINHSFWETEVPFMIVMKS